MRETSSTSSNIHNDWTISRRCKVVIVGAGAAGLACAHNLLKYSNSKPRPSSDTKNPDNDDEDVQPQHPLLLVLEARDRIGGRICSLQKTVSVGDDTTIPFIVEQGAAWIHGIGSRTEWNPMTALILERYTSTNRGSNDNSIDEEMILILKQELHWIYPINPWTRPYGMRNNRMANQNHMAIFYNGTKINPRSKEVSMALDIYQSILKSITGDHLDLNSSTSLADAITQATKVNILYNAMNSNAETKAFVDGIIHLYLVLFQSWTASSLSDTHYSEIPPWDITEDEGRNKDSDIYDTSSHDCMGGYDGDYPGWHCIVRRGMSTILEPLLQQGVEECILLNQEVTTIERCKRNNCDDDDVIRVSTSSGLLIEADICIVSIPLGCLKASLRNERKSIFFSPPLSPSKKEAVDAIRLTSYTKVIVTFEDIFWPTEEPFIGILFDTPDQETNIGASHEFSGQCLVLDNFYARELSVPVIEISIVAEDSQNLRKMRQYEIKASILSCIQKGLVGKCNPVVDVFSKCVSFDIITQWEDDPYSLGAYSGPTVHSSCKHFEHLQEPEWDGKLLFIGEATSSSYPGSVHGALLSGYEMANKIKDNIFSVTLG